MRQLIPLPPVDLLSGWRKVKELDPRVRFALFHSESLPSLRRRGWSAVGSEVGDRWVSGDVGSDITLNWTVKDQVMRCNDCFENALVEPESTEDKK